MEYIFSGPYYNNVMIKKLLISSKNIFNKSSLLFQVQLWVIPGGTELQRHCCDRLSGVTSLSPLFISLYFRKIAQELNRMNLASCSVSNTQSILPQASSTCILLLLFSSPERKFSFYYSGTSYWSFIYLSSKSGDAWVPCVARCQLWL